MDFPSNSHNVTEKSKIKPKADEKKIEKVISGEVTQRKKPLGKRFKNLFTAAEFKGASQYVFLDVLVPALKNMVVDAVDVGVKRVIYGDNARHMPSRRNDSQRSRMTYNSPVNRSQGTMLPGQPPYSPPRSSRSSSEVILNSKEEAELVWSTLVDIIDKYDFASVADFHTIVGLPSTYVDNNWGWSALNYVNIHQVREGWILDLPSVEPLN